MEIKDALELARENYTDYSRYVASGRAFPNILDGLKSVAKRSIYGMWKEAPRSKVKLAKLASYALPYHPHPTSIAGAITQLGDEGNVLKLIDTQGNWGNSNKGIKAAAERYIEGRLSDFAIELCCDGVEYCEFIKGEINEDEPKALPVYIPICFINGIEGIPSGLPKINIPTLYVSDIIDYYLNKLAHKDLKFKPKNLPKIKVSGHMLSAKDECDTMLKTGKGTLKVAPEININNNIITISEFPKGKDIDNVYKILSSEINTDKLDIRDESTNIICVVIEKVKNKSCNMQEIYDRLLDKLSVNISYNMAFFDENYIYTPCSFDKVVTENLTYIYKVHKNRISNQLNEAEKKLKILTIIEDLKQNPENLHKLFSFNHEEACTYIQTQYHCEKDISKLVLQKPISYLTKEHQKEIEDLKKLIEFLEKDKDDIYKVLTQKYKELKIKIDQYLKEK